MGIEPTSPTWQASALNQLNYGTIYGTLDRARTCMIRCRRPLPHPLGYKGIYGVREETWTLTSNTGYQGHNLARLPISPPTPYKILATLMGLEPTTSAVTRQCSNLNWTTGPCLGMWRMLNPNLQIKSLQSRTSILALKVGLEPTTPRLTAVCSTDWAIWEYNFKKCLKGYKMHSIIRCAIVW